MKKVILNLAFVFFSVPLSGEVTLIYYAASPAEEKILNGLITSTIKNNDMMIEFATSSVVQTIDGIINSKVYKEIQANNPIVLPFKIFGNNLKELTLSFSGYPAFAHFKVKDHYTYVIILLNEGTDKQNYEFEVKEIKSSDLIWGVRHEAAATTQSTAK